MRLYEVVYIMDPALDESAVDAKLGKFHELVTSSGGEVSAVDHWGNRQLAYPINKQSSGYYVVAQFTADVDALPEFERLLKLDDEVMRYLLVLNEGEPTTGDSLLADKPPRQRDEDEDDDDDDEPRGEVEEDALMSFLTAHRHAERLADLIRGTEEVLIVVNSESEAENPGRC